MLSLLLLPALLPCTYSLAVSRLAVSPSCSRASAARCISTTERAPSSVCVESLPLEPTIELSAAEVVSSVCEGLRVNDAPHKDAGIERLYNFLTPMGRVAIAPTPPKSGLQGGVTLDYFLKDAGSPALGALIYCTSIKLIGETRITPGTNTRGALGTQLIEVGNSPLADQSDSLASLKALLRADDEFLEAVLASVRTGSELPEPPPGVQVKSRFWVQLEQQRRPPMQGCWLIKEFMPLAMSKFQQLNEGGEEFEGEDS